MFRHHRLGVLGLSVLLLGAGCHGNGSRRATFAEPPVSSAVDGGSDAMIVEAPTARSVTYVDRHPILSKPREYWESSGDNKIVKTAAATFVGVPAGIIGEVKQIVVGAPAQPQ